MGTHQYDFAWSQMLEVTNYSEGVKTTSHGDNM